MEFMNDVLCKHFHEMFVTGMLLLLPNEMRSACVAHFRLCFSQRLPVLT